MRKCEQRENMVKISKIKPGIQFTYKMPIGE